MSEKVTEQDERVTINHCKTCDGKGLFDGTVCAACDGHGVWGIWGAYVLIARLPKVIVFNWRHLISRVMAKAVPLILAGMAILSLALFFRNFWYLELTLHEHIQQFWDLGFFSVAMFISLLAWPLLVYYTLHARFPAQFVKKKSRADEANPALGSDLGLSELLQKIPPEAVVDVCALLHPRARNIFEKALQRVNRKQKRVVKPGEVLRELLRTKTVGQFASRMNLNVQEMMQFIQNSEQDIELRTDDRVVISPALKRVLISAYQEASQLNHAHIHQRDLLLGFFKEDPAIVNYLRERKIYLDDMQNVVYWLDRERERKSWWHRWDIILFTRTGKMDLGWAAGWTVTLDKYSRDLTHLARKKKLREIIGKERELSDLARILGRSGKSSVMLLGDPGVGKSALVEGLAQRVVSGKVEKVLRNKRLIELDIGSIVGSSSNPGHFNQLMSQILREVTNATNVVLVLDNIHLLKGAGAAEGSGLDAFGILEPVLTRAEIQCIGTTTFKEYRRFIETNESFARCFSILEVDEPEHNDLIRILERVVLDFEVKQKVTVSYQAITSAIEFGNKYMQDKVQPDKSIDLLDEAAVAVGRSRKQGVVSPQDVAAIVSVTTKIPVSDLTVDESDKLLRLEQVMHERLVGQDEAVSAVANAVRRARVGIRDMKRPIANFLFVGSTGVGKTELAKTLAASYFGNEKLMIRLDMTEYATKKSLYRLIGSPPGEGSEESSSGFLTEAIRHRPHSLVLLDEFEKASPDVHNVFLQVFDDGRLTDGNGRQVDFTNSILIATSNAGAKMIQDGLRMSRSLDDIRQELLHEVLPTLFRPELLNRFDAIILFKPLERDQVLLIAKRILGELRNKLREQDIALEMEEEAVMKLAMLGFDPTNGARPLRRVIQERVQDPIAGKILRNEVRRGDTLVIKGSDIQLA